MEMYILIAGVVGVVGVAIWFLSSNKGSFMMSLRPLGWL
jgi:hypothetical protein